MKTIIEWVKENNKVTAGLLIAFFQFFYYLGCDYIGIEHADTISYVNHSFAIADLSARPPLYPFIIAVCRALVGSTRCFFAVCLIQITVSIISVFVFYKTCEIAFNNTNIALLTTVFYGCNPAPLYWNTAIMTESLAITLTVFFIYFVVKYIVKNDVASGVCAPITALVAMMVKPTLVIYLGVCIAMLFFQFLLCEKLRKQVIKLSLAVLSCLAIVMGYAGIIYNNSGLFNVSNLGPRHALAISLATETYKNYPDAELVDQIDEIYSEYGRDFGEHAATTKMMELFGNDRISRNRGTSEFVKVCNSYDPMARYEFVIESIINSIKNESYTLGWLYHKQANVLVNIIAAIQKYIFGVMENHLFWLFVIPVCTLISTIMQWIKKKECPWIHLGITGTLLIIIIANYMGSYDSFYRLTVYALPVMYVGVGLITADIFALTKVVKR